jgi:hypothetical protein
MIEAEHRAEDIRAQQERRRGALALRGAKNSLVNDRKPGDRGSQRAVCWTSITGTSGYANPIPTLQR